MRADQFVHSVVPSNILAERQQRAVGVEQRSRVETAGFVEERLRLPERSVDACERR